MSRLSFSRSPALQDPSLASLPPRQVYPSTSNSFHSLISPQPHVAISIAETTPATPQLTLTGPYGGSFSNIVVDDEFIEEKPWAYDPPANATTFIPASRRFLRPDEHPRTPALIAAAGDPRASAKKRRSMFCRIFLVLCVVALAIGLGVGLSKEDSNRAAVKGGKGGIPPTSGTTASEGGIGSATTTTSIFSYADPLLTPPSSATSTIASEEDDDDPGPTSTARWGLPGGNNLGGVFARTGHQGGAALLANPKRMARHFSG
ncbi:hypothetical protein JCM11641_001978 [Rhodosporidiobolus odoratus]